MVTAAARKLAAAGGDGAARAKGVKKGEEEEGIEGEGEESEGVGVADEEEEGAAGQGGHRWDGEKAGRDKVLVSRAAQLAEEALLAAHVRELRGARHPGRLDGSDDIPAAQGAGGGEGPAPSRFRLPPRCVPLLRAAPRGASPPSLDRQIAPYEAGSASGAGGEPRDLLAKAALASAAGIGVLALDERRDVPKMCSVCMSAQHNALGCPAARVMREGGDDGEGGGQGGRGAGGGSWVSMLPAEDLEVLEAVREAADGLLPSLQGGSSGVGSGGQKRGRSGQEGGSGNEACFDARALLAVAVVMQECAREVVEQRLGQQQAVQG